MSDLGWICLHRKMLDWEWYNDANTFRLFVHCLLRANHSDNRWRGHLIKRGQFISSISILSGELGLTIKQIRGSLDKLKRTGEVASESNSQFTVFTVKKYDDYQSEGKPEGKPTASERANEGQAEGKRRATNNNDNNETINTPSQRARDENHTLTPETLPASAIPAQPVSCFAQVVMSHEWKPDPETLNQVQRGTDVTDAEIELSLPNFKTHNLFNSRSEIEWAKGLIRWCQRERSMSKPRSQPSKVVGITQAELDALWLKHSGGQA